MTDTPDWLARAEKQFAELEQQMREAVAARQHERFSLFQTPGELRIGRIADAQRGALCTIRGEGRER